MEKNVISIIVAAGKNLSNAGYSLLASIIIAFFHFLLMLGIKDAGEAAALTFFFGILYLICTIIIISSLLSAGKNLSSLPIQSHQSDKLVKSSSITKINTTRSGEYFAGGIIVYTDTDGNPLLPRDCIAWLSIQTCLS